MCSIDLAVFRIFLKQVAKVKLSTKKSQHTKRNSARSHSCHCRLDLTLGSEKRKYSACEIDLEILKSDWVFTHKQFDVLKGGIPLVVTPKMFDHVNLLGKEH